MINTGRLAGKSNYTDLDFPPFTSEIFVFSILAYIYILTYNNKAKKAALKQWILGKYGVDTFL